jgi:hypothetical protein
MGFTPSALDLWQLLAVAGGLVLFVEWMRFGRRRVVVRRKDTTAGAAPRPPAREQELVSK